MVIDAPDPSAAPPRPELRRWKVPIGTVAVFAASNFPFAFSVPGGDTASALAAGCPVVVKAHPDHPQTSELAAATLRAAAEKVGLPADVLSLIHGYQAGADLVRHPLIAAVGFTGSIPGGRALFDLAAARPSRSRSTASSAASTRCSSPSGPRQPAPRRSPPAWSPPTRSARASSARSPAWCLSPPGRRATR